MLCHPCFSGIQNKGEQNQKRSPTKVNKIRSGYLTHAFSGDQRGTEILCHPCVLGDPQQKGSKTKSGAPTKGNKFRSGYLTLPFSEAQRRANMLRHPCILGDPKQRGAKPKLVPDKGEQNQEWLPHPCVLGGPKEGKNGTSPLHSWGSPTKGKEIRNVPQQSGTKSEVATSRDFSGAQRRAKCYVTLHSRASQIKGSKTKNGHRQRGTKSEEVPDKGKQNQKWLPQPYLLRGPKAGKNAVSPMHSQGSQQRRAKPKVVPRQGGTTSEVATSPLPSRGPKRGEMLRHPCIHEDPQ